MCSLIRRCKFGLCLARAEHEVYAMSVRTGIVERGREENTVGSARGTATKQGDGWMQISMREHMNEAIIYGPAGFLPNRTRGLS
jgi:hypothetical protein